MKEPPRTKYSLTVRLLHGLHTIAFIILAITGFMLVGGTVGKTSLATFHNLVGHFWVALPVVYFIIRPKTAIRGVGMLCRWSREDRAWLRAAPRYYLLHDRSAGSPQGYTGRKLWWLLTFLSWVVISISGLIKEVFVNQGLSPSTVHAMTYVHDITFGLVGFFFLVHVYLMLFRRRSLRYMVTGR